MKQLLNDRQLAAMLPTRPQRQRAIYVLQFHTLCKIGVSVDPTERVRAIMLPSRPKLVRVHWAKDAGALERALHKKFKDKRVHGEWFDLDALDFVEIDEFCESWTGKGPGKVYTMRRK